MLPAARHLHGACVPSQQQGRLCECCCHISSSRSVCFAAFLLPWCGLAGVAADGGGGVFPRACVGLLILLVYARVCNPRGIQSSSDTVPTRLYVHTKNNKQKNNSQHKAAAATQRDVSPSGAIPQDPLATGTLADTQFNTILSSHKQNKLTQYWQHYSDKAVQCQKQTTRQQLRLCTRVRPAATWDACARCVVVRNKQTHKHERLNKMTGSLSLKSHVTWVG